MAAVFGLTSCGMHVETGPTSHESQAVDRDAAKTLRAELRMGAGTLEAGGGSSKWLQADFAYNVPSFKPNVRYSKNGDRGELVVEQPETGHGGVGNTVNEWHLRFNEAIPSDITVRLGAGEARLNLGALTLTSVNVEMGAGELRLDLRGNPTHDYDVKVRGGAGEATIYLPKDAGIEAKASGGIGEIKVTGLRKDGDHWVNDAHGTSKVQVKLDVQGGVGQINVIAE